MQAAREPPGQPGMGVGDGPGGLGGDGPRAAAIWLVSSYVNSPVLKSTVSIDVSKTNTPASPCFFAYSVMAPMLFFRYRVAS